MLAVLDEAHLHDAVDRLSAVHEARIAGKPPWTTAAMEPSVLAAKLRGITAVSLTIDEVRGTRKLSQNKSPTDRQGVIAALGDHPLGHWMAGLSAAGVRE